MPSRPTRGGRRIPRVAEVSGSLHAGLGACVGRPRLHSDTLKFVVGAHPFQTTCCHQLRRWQRARPRVQRHGMERRLRRFKCTDEGAAQACMPCTCALALAGLRARLAARLQQSLPHRGGLQIVSRPALRKCRRPLKR